MTDASKLSIRSTPELDEALDAFMAENPEVKNRSAAVRVLVMTALEKPRLRVIASETLTSWAAVERHFYAQMFALLRRSHAAAFARFREGYDAMYDEFRERYESMMGTAMQAEGWDADFVADVARDVRERRAEHQRSRREEAEAAGSK